MSEAKDTTHPAHLWKIDVLRAIAFLGVFFVHFPFFVPLNTPAWYHYNGYLRDYTQWSLLRWLCYPLTLGGNGVVLFFVISGFCLHYGFLQRKTPFQPGEFLGRRLLRIYPAYLVNMVFCLFIQPWHPDIFWHWIQIPAHLLMIHNLYQPTFFGINGVYWTLGVEFQFYLLYPIVLLLRHSLGIKGCLVFALALNLITQLTYSLTISLPGGATNPDWTNPLITWCDWILGACVAEAYFQRQPLFQKGFVMFFLGLGLLLVSINFRPLVIQSLLFASVVAAAGMDLYLQRKRAPYFLEKTLIFLGMISYSLYLWHPLSLFMMEAVVQKMGLDRTGFLYPCFLFILNLGLLLPLGWASWYFIECGVPATLRAWGKKKSLPFPAVVAFVSDANKK